jgi:outer membrane receptor protein involved in Fe transport
MPVFRLKNILPLGFAAGAAFAHADVAPVMQEVVVSGARTGLVDPADSASDGAITARQLATRPLLRASEVLEAVPGMIVTQHSGDGKANQYFLRGYNLDHGSDFATSLLDMPVNVASHAHGQGYMDLNFLIPELVAGIHYRKGVYAAEDGDLSTTGSARIVYQRRLPAPFADLTVGPHRFRRLLGAGSGEAHGLHVLGALEVAGNDGPWDQPEQVRKFNGVLRASTGSAHNGYSVTAMAYRSSWTATEHVPERAIDTGEIGRYGALSTRDGGVTHRASLSADWARADACSASKASAYVADYGLNLFSAPSGFMNGAQGDQHEQEDRRTTMGAQASHAWQAAAGTEVTLGLQLRHDRVGTVGLYHTVDRVRTGTVRQDRVRETAGAAYAQARTEWTPWLRTTLGLRYDRINASVVATGGQFNMANGGNVSAGQASPKVAVIFGPFGPRSATELYVNWGTGYHSNDVRGATSVINPADGSGTEKLRLFARAKGGEAGLRTTVLPGWSSSLTAWRMRLGSELVFIGDEGVTEARGASARHGVEWSNFYTPNRWLIINGDVAWSRARFVAPSEAGADAIPNAIPLTASLGIGAAPGGLWFGGLRLRYLGAYPLEETGAQKSTPFMTANLKLGYRITPKLQLSADMLNLFDRKANDIEYWGGACTRAEQADGSCGGGIDGRLVHPLEPRTLRVSLRASF